MKETKLTTIYLCPDFSTGCKYPVAIAAQRNGDGEALPLIDTAEISELFGKSAKSVAGALSLIIDDLSLHLQAGHAPDSWDSPVSGVSKGETVSVGDKPIPEAIKQAKPDLK